MPTLLRFDGFEVDLAAGRLFKQGMRIRLREQSFQVLAMLLEHPGDVVTREDLRRRLWPAEVFIDFENSLNAAVARLREALGDSAERPRFIETLPKRGYRFIGTVRGSRSRSRDRDGGEKAPARAPVREPDRRSGPGVLERRDDRRGDHRAGGAGAGRPRRDRLHDGDALQGHPEGCHSNRPRAECGLRGGGRRPPVRRRLHDEHAARSSRRPDARLGETLRFPAWRDLRYPGPGRAGSRGALGIGLRSDPGAVETAAVARTISHDAVAWNEYVQGRRRLDRMRAAFPDAGETKAHP